MKTSVIISTYNGMKYITEQLDSIMAQTELPDEVVIIDDCSTDETYEYMCKYINEKVTGVELGDDKSSEGNDDTSANVKEKTSFAKSVNSVKWQLYRNESNKGWECNFWEGIQKTSGDIIFTCDQDDIWEMDKIAVCKKYMQDSSINVLVSNYYLLDEVSNKRETAGANVNQKDENAKVESSTAESIKVENTKVESTKVENHKLENAKVESAKAESAVTNIEDKLGHLLNDSNPSRIMMSPDFFNVKYPGCVYCFRRTYYDELNRYWKKGFPHDAMLWRYAILDGSLYSINEPLISWRRHKESVFTKAGSSGMLKKAKLEWIDYANAFVDGMIKYSDDIKSSVSIEEKSAESNYKCNDDKRYINDEKYEINKTYLDKFKRWLALREKMIAHKNIIAGIRLSGYVKLYGSFKSYLADWYRMVR